MSAANSTLSALVSTTPHLLAYSVPLLLFSVPLTFAGTFLTLDRSRSFPSSYAPVPLPGAFDGPKKKSKIAFSLQGGMGGLAIGYVFGVHVSTFLSLLVPAISSSAALSSNSFLAVWILSCISTTVLGGRYRYCARLFGAICGGSLLALTICLIIHPPLLPRQVLTALFPALSLLLILLFSLPRLFHLLRPTLRVLTASSGAFSLVLSIALLAHIPAWADIWERLWLHDGATWGSSKEKGLSAAYCILLCAGIATDWALNRWFGECPDEKWDSYLANYSANLPNDSSRAGSFEPLPSKSPWRRLFGSPSKLDKKDILFPLSPPANNRARNSMTKDPAAFLSDDEYSQDLVKSPISDHHLPYDDLPASPAFLKQGRSQNAKFKPQKKATSHKNIGRRRPIKFGADLSSDSSDDDSDRPNTRNARPWLQQKASMDSSSPTLVDEPVRASEYDLDLELGRLKKAKTRAVRGINETPDYSDYEEDLGSPKTKPGLKEGDTGWSPGFMKRYSSAAGVNGAEGSTGGISSTSSQNGVAAVPLGAVPATPSLIKALDRISAAQRDAFGPSSVFSTPTSAHPSSSFNMKKTAVKVDGLPKVQELDNDDDDDGTEVKHQAPRWDDFWREVKHKARS
ncbi:hypothetical protein FPV67DRAFT_1479250 [Lyophyllum atratum]|nr:hypothetical protein FPV67DRAFT_1479250 [Lyophyllum atratum]